MLKDVDLLYCQKKRDLISELVDVTDVSATVDIWTDRNMRAFRGITVHYISTKDRVLKSALLCCLRMSGKIFNGLLYFITSQAMNVTLILNVPFE